MSYRRQFENALAHRNMILEDIKSFTESVLLDIVDCEMRVSDGLAKTGDGTGRGTDVPDPTQRAALRLAGKEETLNPDGTVKYEAEPDTWQETEADPVAEAIRECLGSLAEAAGALKQAKRKIPVITDAGARLRNRENSIDQCGCCDKDVLGTRDDRLKAGFCSACYEAWRRTRFSDRFVFVRERAAELKRQKAMGNAKTAGA